MLFLGIIIGLIALTLIVTLHELGHFWAARRGGVYVEEFGIGMPPKAWQKKTRRFRDLFKKSDKIKDPKPKKGQPRLRPFIFSLNWLPIGGFCRMKGESSQDISKGSFGAATFKAKTLILFGGVLMNLLTAALIFTTLMWTGMPRLLANQVHIPADTRIVSSSVTVSRLLEGSPAAEAGFSLGDEIISVAGTPVPSAAVLPNITAAHAGETVEVIARRTGTTCQDPDMPPFNGAAVCGTQHTYEFTKTVTLNDGQDGRGYLGLSAESSERIYATWSAPLVGIALTAQLTGETIRGVGTIFSNLGSGLVRQFHPASDTREAGRAEISAASDGVTGPVGIIGIIFPNATAAGPSMILLLVAIISLSLAVMNLLPIPALDGGRWLMLLVAKLRGKPLSEEREQKLITYSFVAVLALGGLIIILDVVRLF
ncbi:site-2 protease family protein [Candidatus Saccharibacteria bacterium]|nr:site-2 protease family protein [Candidatus Saccharibacteria bacterium]